jgi:hypothetical protein
MRRILLAFALLTACDATAPDGSAVTGASALAAEEIQTTTLDAAPEENPAEGAASSAPSTQRPEPRPEVAEPPATPDQDAAPEAEATEEPEAPKSAEQTLCERSGGQWATVGESGAHSCIRPTRDGGESCTKQGDCQGMCLARSGTCAPFAPLFGCNDVLDKQGRRMTLCIE